ncbi:ATP-binding cassette domain-containing protein [Salirhabdus salicampi]|nr:ATP-binding cassette domain-containing protein [Salirhabdus salicampi]
MENNNQTDVHVQIDKLKKSYGDLNVLKGIDLNIAKGEFIAIVGKSGCGKSTLLRLIAGLESYNEGGLYINGKKLTSLNKEARLMYQDGRLLPWKKVIDNIGLGLKGDWYPKALDALRSVGLEDRKNDWPSHLSGGQKQRVALARALVYQPGLLLLDEPLGALDALTRIEMQELIESIWQQKQITSILVTHDVEEAVALADRVILIDQGNITLDVKIDLPRPRKRTQLTFSEYVDQILTTILGRKREGDEEDSNDLRLIVK